MREALWPRSSLLAPRGGRYSGIVIDGRPAPTQPSLRPQLRQGSSSQQAFDYLFREFAHAPARVLRASRAA